MNASEVAAWLDAGPPPEHAAFFQDLYRWTQATPENREVLRGFSEAVTRTLLAYHFFKNTLLYHRNVRGQVDGLLLWYRCNENWTWREIRNWQPDEPGGDCFFLAFCWAAPGALPALLLSLVEREPEVLTGRLFSIRERAGKPQRVEYSRKTGVKILKRYGKR